MLLLTKITLCLAQVHIIFGACSFPAAFTNQEYWFRSKESAQSTTYHSYIRYTTSGIIFYRSDQWQTNPVTEQCNVLRLSAGDKKLEYIRHQTGQSVSNCVIDHLLPDGIILHKETHHSTLYTTLQQCQTAINGATLYQVYLPAKKENDVPSSLNLDFSNPVHFRVNSGPFHVSFSTDSSKTDKCHGDASSAAALTKTSIYTNLCNEILQANLPNSGAINLLAEFDPRYLGEGTVDNGAVLIVQWDKLYCVRYQIVNDVLFLSFDLDSAAQMLDCQKNARYDWAGEHDGRHYVLLKLSRVPGGTTLTHGLTTRSFWFSSTTTFSPTTISTLFPTTTTLVSPDPSTTTASSSTASTSTTTTTTTTTTTPTPETTLSTTTLAPNDRKHVQFVISQLQYDSLSAEQKTKVKAELLNQIATASGVSKDTITNIVLDKDNNGDTVVTFDMKASSISTQKLRQNINTGQYKLTVNGQQYNMKANSLYTWKDNSPCPHNVCENGTRCWIIQTDHECLKVGTSGNSTNTGGLTKTSIYVIVGVCSFVALFLIILVVICVIRSSHSKKEPVYEDNYHTDYPVPTRVFDPDQD